MLLKKIFKTNRIVGVIGNPNSGKTNNIIYLVESFLKINPKANVVIYGFNQVSTIYLKKLGCTTADSLAQLSLVNNSLIVLDEFQKLHLSDKRYRELSQEFFDFIFHNNNWLILSSPNLSEFNKLVCRRVDAWLIKELYTRDLVNGSKVKTICEDYKGFVKSLGRFNIDKNKILFLSDIASELLNVSYIKSVDTKLDNIDIFLAQKSPKKSPIKVKR